MSAPPSIDPPHLSSHASSSSGSDSSYPYGLHSSKPEGYDYEFVPKVDERYECSICLLVLREPRQTPCGHRFCRDCIVKWLRESQSRCPIDNQDLIEKDLYPDNFARREIQNFNVCCPNKKYGCAVITTVKLVPNHQSECMYSQVPCPNKCGALIQRQGLEGHITHQCDRRAVNCPDCNQSLFAFQLENHQKSCPKGQVKCEYCGEEILREVLNSHEESCPNKIIPCSFVCLGCEVQVQRCEYEAHLHDSISSHLNLLCTAVTRLYQHFNLSSVRGASGQMPTREMSPTEMSSIMSCIGQSVQRMSLDTFPSSDPRFGPQGAMSMASHPPSHGLPHSVTSLDSGIQTGRTGMRRSPSDPKQQLYSGAVSTGTMEASHLEYTSSSDSSGANMSPQTYTASLSFAHPRSGLGDSFSKSGMSLQDEQQKVFLHEHTLRELQIKFESMEKLYKQKLKQHEIQFSEMEGRMCNGTFFWKIRNYSRYQREAEHGETTALHSQAFYSAPSGGYKLCVRANLNGVDSARGSHLSLFVHFMQGDYDDVIEWPFGGRIVLSVMDQNDICEMRNHVTETLAAKPNLAAFQKPTTPRNHKGFGYMEFLPLSVLKHSSYIKNDTLIIKAQVLPAE